MAGGRIAGITVEISADAAAFQKEIKGIDKNLNKTRSSLKDIDKLLKLNPTSTELLTQKQKQLKSAIEGTKNRLEVLKNEQKNVAKGSAEWDNLQREIIATEQDLKKLEKEYRQFGSVASQQVIAVGKQLQATGKKVEDVGKKLKGFSGAGAAVFTGLAGLGYKAVTTADELNELANKTGFSTEELQKFQYASDRVDTSLDTITGALTKMKKNMTGHSDTWETLGISVTNADGSMRGATSVFYDALEALSKVDNETERDQLAMDIFGKSADELSGIIDDGGAALKEYGQEAEDLGLILGQDVLDEMNEVNDQIDKSKAQVKAAALEIGAKVGKVLIPVIDKIAAGIEKVVGWLDKLSPETLKTVMTIAGIVAVAAPLLIVIGKVISGVGTAIVVIGKVMSVLAMVNPVVLLIVAAIAALVAAGIWLYKNWDTVKAKAVELWQNVVTTWNNLKESVVNTVTELKESIAEKWDALKTTVTDRVQALRDGIIQKFNDLKAKLKSIVDNIKRIFNFQWKVPQLKLPHLTITYEAADSAIAKFFGVNKIPHLSVEWYRKAMENPVLFTSPTVMATPNGYKGFGDNGAEIVMGLDKLRQMVGAGQNVTVNVVLQGDARGLFKVINQTNNTRTRATGYNALAMG